MHTDIPTGADLERLLSACDAACVSIYLPTAPAERGGRDRIEFKNLSAQALDQVSAPTVGRAAVSDLSDVLEDLVDDDAFWTRQAHSLAVFATPSGARTFQVADHLSPIVEVSDRFHVKPLLRSATFPQAAYVLAPVLATGRGGTQAAPLRPRPAADPGGDRDLSRTVSAPRRMGNRAHRPPQRRSAVLSDWARSEADKTTKRTGSRRNRRRSRTPIRRGGAPRRVSWPRVAHSGG